MIQIQNNRLSVMVNPMGAELSSLRSLSDGYEYLWQGNPSVWAGHSPLLFPIVGRLKDDRYTFEGKEYVLQKHGFARQELFRVGDQTDTSVSFCFDDWKKHFESYPFQYRLTVRYTLQEDTLTVAHEVENLSETPMYFSIGAHPGFRCGKGAFLEFPMEETVQAQRFNEDKIIRPEREPFLDHARVYPLKEETFLEDAYILEGLSSPCLSVVDPGASRRVRIAFGGAPFLGLWAKPGADYVCVEPWYGVDDDTFQTGKLSEKKGIQRLEGKERFCFSVQITPEE